MLVAPSTQKGPARHVRRLASSVSFGGRGHGAGIPKNVDTCLHRPFASSRLSCMHPSLSGEGKFLVRGYRPNQQASGCLTLRSFEEAEVEAFRPHKPSINLQAIAHGDGSHGSREARGAKCFLNSVFFLIVISRGLLRLAGRGLSPLWVVVPAYSTKRFSCRSKFERLKGPDRELLELRAWAQAQRAWEPVRTASLHGREHLCNFGVPVRCAETASLPKTTALPKPEGEEEL